MKTAKPIPPFTNNKFIKQFLVDDSFGDLGNRLGETNKKRLLRSNLHQTTPVKKNCNTVKTSTKVI